MNNKQILEIIGGLQAPSKRLRQGQIVTIKDTPRIKASPKWATHIGKSFVLCTFPENASKFNEWLKGGIPSSVCDRYNIYGINYLPEDLEVVDSGIMRFEKLMYIRSFFQETSFPFEYTLSDAYEIYYDAKIDANMISNISIGRNMFRYDIIVDIYPADGNVVKELTVTGYYKDFQPTHDTICVKDWNGSMPTGFPVDFNNINRIAYIPFKHPKYNLGDYMMVHIQSNNHIRVSEVIYNPRSDYSLPSLGTGVLSYNELNFLRYLTVLTVEYFLPSTLKVCTFVGYIRTELRKIYNIKS